MLKVRALFVGASLCLGAAAAGAQTAPDAVIADHDAHQVALENDHVRVIRALAPMGRKSPMHTHPPLLLVSLGSGRVRFTMPDGTKPILDLWPGRLIWIDGTEHAWEVLAGEVNVVAVEVKAAKAAKAK
jgi:hypothetical protein